MLSGHLWCRPGTDHSLQLYRMDCRTCLRPHLRSLGVRSDSVAVLRFSADVMSCVDTILYLGTPVIRQASQGQSLWQKQLVFFDNSVQRSSSLSG